MRPTFIIALLFFCFTIENNLFAQQKKDPILFEKEIRIKSDPFIGETNFYKARSFFLQKEWDSTLVYSAQQLNQPVKDSKIQDFCHFFRAYSFNKKKLFQEAKKEFSKISYDFEFYIQTNIYLGEIAIEQREFQKAIDYFKIIEKSNDHKLISKVKVNIEHNLGICYLHLKQYDKSEAYLLKSIEAPEVKKDTLKLARFYGDMGVLYYEQYNDELAISYFQKAYQLSKSTKDYKVKQNMALNMAVVEENRKKFSESLRYRKEYEKWKDSLNNQSKIWEVARIEKEFAIKQKQKEVSLLKSENKAKVAERNGFLYTAIALLLLLLTTIYFYREKVKSTRIITTQKEDLDALNATKDQILSILSHDLRSSIIALKYSNRLLSDELAPNNLDNVNSLLDQNSTMVNSLYNLLDNLLHWALSQTKNSYFEITSLRLLSITEQVVYNYLPLMKEKNIIFTNNVLKSDMIQADQESFKIVLRNLIDNAIKFSDQDGTITLYTQNTHDMYCDLVIQDTGAGMTEETRLELLKDSVLLAKKEHEDKIGTGLGVQLCKTMIKKNQGMFAIESTLGKGTKMIVSLPKALTNG
ncbi:histidine kinase [Aquimarina sp. AD10]|uniref:tetratricopeptide repeat-containing sensor histidine kinase n=1 Tax=Aquimarina sp. AD10 TaxID=1714849 RepID=UPI000E4DD681|nr:tetratricopeptide repeat-containing sensor histidine kinase [Aquimarina sp. AD10]AXT59298.1 histidine kinase [Aquimarina sp. AD10]RKM95195.1 histidine kinase [Aquimarina sp. AD10]